MPARVAKTGALGVKLGTACAPASLVSRRTFRSPFSFRSLPLCFTSGIPFYRAARATTVSVRPSNVRRDLPTVPAVVLLLDEATGLPSALMQARVVVLCCATTVAQV
jgi:ornithine cyclodeaminase/alanine dehydrogenase-like protein (mu-crystallin family)